MTQHNTPPMNVPPQIPTYSALETHEAGGEKKEKYDVLQHKKGTATGGVPSAKKVGLEKNEEYGELNNGEVFLMCVYINMLCRVLSCMLSITLMMAWPTSY